MARESLGLFDRPPSQNEVRLGLAIVGFVLLAFSIILPLRDVRLAPVYSFVPIMDSIVFVSELIIGTLLYGQAAVFRSRALTVLGSVYIFGTLLLVPHALTFPGAFMESGLLGAGVSTAGYLSMFWRIAFPLGIIAYALLLSVDSKVPAAPERMGSQIRTGLLTAFTLACLATLLVTLGHDWLPSLFVDHSRINSNLLVLTTVTAALAFCALAMLFFARKSVLDMWLIVALACWLVQSILTIPLTARFTLGWYGLWLMMLLSSLIVMLALLVEANRLYEGLARSNESRKRALEDRLMSMDAVAAAMAHEVGQPLAAIRLNATASLEWLHSENPNMGKAANAIQSAIGAADRTFEVIKSVRAMFAKGSGSRSEVDINGLVLDVSELLKGELAAGNIELILELDESLPPIAANPIQIQRVLTNLLTNAVESVNSTQGGRRNVTVRTTQKESNLVLEVADSGNGLAADKLPHIFDPFFTTKSNGTGLGLSLSRTIVEEHGGRLAAEQREGDGAIFRVRLPLDDARSLETDHTAHPTNVSNESN